MTLLESARTPIDSAGIKPVRRMPARFPLHPERPPNREVAIPKANAATNRIELDDAGGSPAVPAPAPTPAGAARIAPADAQIHASAAEPIAEEAAPPIPYRDPQSAIATLRSPIARTGPGRLDVEVAEIVSHAQTEDSSAQLSGAATDGAADSSRAHRGTAGIQTLHQARTLLDSGRFDRALRAVESGLEQSEVDPINAARLWRLKAEILAKMGRTDEARLARETAAKLDPLR